MAEPKGNPHNPYQPHVIDTIDDASGREVASGPTTSLPELTPRAIVLGLILSVVMGAANVYVGLKAGMTVSASIPAAVMAMPFAPNEPMRRPGRKSPSAACVALNASLASSHSKMAASVSHGQPSVKAFGTCSPAIYTIVIPATKKYSPVTLTVFSIRACCSPKTVPVISCLKT